MKIATTIVICVFAGAAALGCSGSKSAPGGFGSATGDDGTSSSGSNAATSSSGSSSGTTSSGGGSPSTSGSSSSGGSATSSTSSGGSSGGTADDAGAAASNDGGTDPETDYTQTKTVTMTPFSVAPNAEVYYCQSFANPWGAQVDIKTYSLDMAAGSHHMFAFYQSSATNGSVAACPAGGLTFGAFTFSSQTRQVTQTYPATVGATIPAGTGFNMMVHYLNTSATTIMSHVALTMYVAKQSAVTQHAGVIFLNNAGISIQANSTQTATSSYTLPQAVSIMYSDAHMHNRANLFTATVATSGGNKTLYTTTEWQEPPALAYNPPLQLSAGTTITWSCQYVNNTNNTLTFGESAQTNVMCISSSIFYPVSDVTNPVLGSPISGLL